MALKTEPRTSGDKGMTARVNKISKVASWPTLPLSSTGMLSARTANLAAGDLETTVEITARWESILKVFSSPSSLGFEFLEEEEEEDLSPLDLFCVDDES